MGFAGNAVKGSLDRKAARDNRTFAERQQRAGMQMINELDYEPMYASQNVPTYQRSQSPVARSYIESMLMGNNPDTINPNAPNARRDKAVAQGKQNAMFGTPEQRLAQQREYFAKTPWAVTTPTRPVKAPDTSKALWTGENSELASFGVNKDLNDALLATGTDLNNYKMRAENHKGSPNDALRYMDETKAVGTLLQSYGGDAARLAADVRAAGGYRQLMAQRGMG